MKLNCSKLTDKDTPKVDLKLLNNVSISIFFYTEEEFLEFLGLSDQTPFLKRYIRSMLNNTRINFDSFGPYHLAFNIDTIIDHPANYKGKRVAFKVLGRLAVTLKSPLPTPTQDQIARSQELFLKKRWYEKVLGR